jgi:hypothetical protein
MRQRIVPAYTFTRFLELPPELQLKIWSMASRTLVPRTYSLVCMQCDSREDFRSCHKGSSRIKSPLRSSPAILHVCRSSRAEALKVYANLSVDSVYYSAAGPKTYINTLYNHFYMGLHSWDGFKVLVDSLIKLNTTQPFQASFHPGLEGLRAEAFPKLETLRIAFYPFPTLETPEMSSSRCGADDRNIHFIEPQRGTKHGKRAAWIVKSALEALPATCKAVPDWKVPKLEAIVRLIGDEDIDGEVVEAWTYNAVSDDEDEEEADDSTWYEQAAARMSFPTLPTEQMKRLKRKYHPIGRSGLGTRIGTRA